MPSTSMHEEEDSLFPLCRLNVTVPLMLDRKYLPWKNIEFLATTRFGPRYKGTHNHMKVEVLYYVLYIHVYVILYKACTYRCKPILM